MLALQCKRLSKVCHVHVVLSALYLEKMVTKQNVKDLKAAKWPWKRLVQIQCTKLPDVVKKTAELLAKVGHNDEASLLKGQ